MWGCFVRCKSRNKTCGGWWARRTWWVFSSSKKMRLVVFLLEETRFVCTLLLSEILLRQWLQSHNPGILFEVFFKFVTKRSNFCRIIFDVLWTRCYSREIKFVENPLYMPRCIVFASCFLNEFREFFCVNRTEILVCCASFVRKFFFQFCKSFLRQRCWSPAAKAVFETACFFVLRNQSAYRWLMASCQVSDFFLCFSLLCPLKDKFSCL